jgi:serine phosphatase RsbU (regulator of sigma subunit)
MGDRRALDALGGQVIADLLARSHLLEPGMVAGALVEAASPLGISAAQIYLSDLQQRYLRPMPGGTLGSAEAHAIETTVAGRAYRSIRVQHSPASEDEHGQRLWLPLVDGTERLGVLELAVADVSAPMLDWYRALASLAGLMIVSKTGYSDTYAQTRRSQEMALQAELVWALLAPRTFATDRVLVAATLEPAYAVGGDAFDYSLLGDHLNVSIFDGTGHDLTAGLLASVAMASCRSTRRSGGTLPDVVAQADHAIAAQFGDNRFVTALLCDLDLASGLFTWIPCGHPPPLLIRRNKVVKELDRRQQLPLGLAEIDQARRQAQPDTEPDDAEAAPLHGERLEPQDRVLLYTDGITEGRAADGSPFGVERLSDFIIRHSHAGTPASETVRRLHHAISDYQHGRLADDATIVMVEWLPDRPHDTLTPD